MDLLRNSIIRMNISDVIYEMEIEKNRLGNRMFQGGSVLYIQTFYMFCIILIKRSAEELTGYSDHLKFRNSCSFRIAEYDKS